MRGFGFGRWLKKNLGGGKQREEPKGPEMPPEEPQVAPEQRTGEEPTQAPEQPIPEQPEESPVQVNPQTDMPPRDIPDEVIDEAIYETGAAGDMGPVEAATLQGRMEPRRNINLDFFNDDNTKRVIEFYNDKMEGFQDNPTRRRVSHEETISKSVASEDVEVAQAQLNKILNGKLDDKWLPEDMVSIYTMVREQADALSEYARNLKAQRTAGVEVATEDLAHYQLLATRFVALQEIASVRAAEAGRLLNSLQAVSKTERAYLEHVKTLVREAGGPETLWANIDTVADGKSVEDVANRVRQSWGQKAWNTAIQLRYNMMLSSVRTHAANIAGSTMTGLWEAGVVNPTKVLMSNVFDPAAKTMLNLALSPTGIKLNVADRMALSEAVDLPVAMVKSARRSFVSTFWKTLKGEGVGTGKVYNEAGIREGDPEIMGGGFLPRKVQIPVRMLEAEDAAFKATYGNAAIDVAAKRKAISEGTTPEEIDELYHHYMRNPTEEMVNEATEFARKLTFTNDPSAYGQVLGTLGRAAEMLQGHPLGRLVLPFVRTPTNIVGYTLEQSGLGAANGPMKFFKDLNDPQKAADAESRLAIAGGLMYLLYDWWQEGMITGDAPDNYGELRVRETAGWRPNSIRFGDEYYQLNRMDPMGLITNAYATFFDARAHMTEESEATAAFAVMVGVASMIADRSMLASIGDVERIFQASEATVGRPAGKFIARQATSFVVPSLARDIREIADPYQRSLDVPTNVESSTWQAIKKTVMNAVPYLSEQIPPQVDAYGNDKLSTAGRVWRGLVPMRTSEIHQDPVTATLVATRIPVNKPDYLIKIPNVPNAPSIDLLAIDGGAGWVYRKYQQKVGKLRYDMLSKLVNSQEFKDAAAEGKITPDSVYADQIRTIVSKARRLATLEFITKDLSGKKRIQPKVAGENIGSPIEFNHPFSVEQYKEFVRALSYEGPTEPVMEKVEEAGLKYKHKPELQGTPPEMRLQSPRAMPRF